MQYIKFQCKGTFDMTNFPVRAIYKIINIEVVKFVAPDTIFA